MLRRLRITAFGLVVLAGGFVSGCSGSLSTSSLGLPTSVELPKLPELPKLADLPALPNLPAGIGYAKASPIEAYAQVARGATLCWFGAGGQLKKTHIFYADADSPINGGKAEIALLERDASAVTGRGAKVYRIGFSGEGTGTRVDLTNHKLAEPLVAGIEADVQRFANGDLACATTGATAPRLEPVIAQASAPKAKSKTKSVPRN